MSQLSLAEFSPEFLEGPGEDAHERAAESILSTVRDICDLHGHDKVASALGRPRQSLSAAVHEMPEHRNRKRIYLSDLPALLELDLDGSLINQLVAMTVGRHAPIDLVNAAMETIADPEVMTTQQRKSFLRGMKTRADRSVAMKRLYSEVG